MLLLMQCTQKYFPFSSEILNCSMECSAYKEHYAVTAIYWWIMLLHLGVCETEHPLCFWFLYLFPPNYYIVVYFRCGDFC